jgi:DNA primase
VMPETSRARQRAASEIAAHPEWLEGMAAGDLIEALALAPAGSDPLETAPDDRSREALARVLHEDSGVDEAMLDVEIVNVLHTLERRRLERRQRELRSLMVEAERRGDAAVLGTLSAESVQVNRALRTL